MPGTNVTEKASIVLDFRPHFSYWLSISLIEGSLREGTFGSGASAVLPRGLATCAGAALGIILFGTTAEAWGASTGLGQEKAGNARRNRVPGSMAWS